MWWFAADNKTLLKMLLRELFSRAKSKVLGRKV